MFPTFTGTSRRPRNVNLSGQRNKNPFAAHALTPSTGTGASKTVADAQAGRRQRQQERNEQKAVRTLQRVWRGHKARQTVKTVRREALAALYSPTSAVQQEQRVSLAFPLLLTTFDARRDDDRQLLERFAGDLAQRNYAPLTSGELPSHRLWHFVQILISSLHREPTFSLLNLLLQIIRRRPHALLNSLGPYFRLLAEYCSREKTLEGEALSLVQDAVLAPLTVTDSALDDPSAFSHRAYHELAASFLTRPLDLVAKNEAFFSQHIDLDALSRAIIEMYSSPKHRPAKSPEPLLWLLAHVIGLQRKQRKGASSTLLYLRAIYTQLSALSGEIRVRLPNSQPSSKEPSSLPSYVSSQIRSLVDKTELKWLLDKFTSGQADFKGQDHASLLAAYTVTLIRCFPDKADDIRMLLFLADFPSKSGLQPAVQFFWTASSATRLFGSVLASSKSTLDFLLRRKYFPPSAASGDDSPWDREWRTVLLFLELYTFVMRLTDDEDFFAVLELDAPSLAGSDSSPSSRLRSSALRLDSLKRLSLFLKNLAFTLYYNAGELLQDSTHNGNAVSLEFRSSQQHHAGTYNVISGVDFEAFKSIVTTAIQMLYERDSRRQFLPTGHWLMTSNFDMDSFLSAVVLEEQRQHELQEQGDGSDEDVDMDDNTDDEDVTRLGVRPISLTTRYAMLERYRRQNRKSRRERSLAEMGPKLEILRNMPYALPFDLRVKIFRQFVYLDKDRRREGNIDPDLWRFHVIRHHGGGGLDLRTPGSDFLSRHTARIERDRVFESAYERFYNLGEGLKEPIQITFLDEYGNEEAGIDGGGVTKEFLMSATKDVFSLESDGYRRFVSNKENALYPNPLALDQLKDQLRARGVSEGSAEWNGAMTEMMQQYEFMGRIVGKCMYEGILLDAVFAGFFLLKWSVSATDSAYRASINDLRGMDEDLYQGMLRLKSYDGDVSALELNFTLEDQVSRAGHPLRTETRNLVPNGENIAVTNENRLLYISYATRHRLVAQPYMVTRAFLRGLGMIIDPAWLRMFNQNELQRLVGGDSSEIDVEDLRRHTVYAGVYEIGDDGEEHTSVKLFWEAMQSLADEDRRLLLKFVTSTPRAPLLGFSQLQPNFSIRDGGNDETRLPSASTCINLLKLPRYTTAETMRSKLIYAIRSKARFDLS